MVSSNGGTCNGFTVNVDGKDIAATDQFNLLGVAYNRQFLTAPHIANVAKAAKQRASLIMRLSHHLPQGRYFRQLASGLVLGKINHALPAGPPRGCLRPMAAQMGPTKPFRLR
jgi:hypothetical protein